MTETRKPRKATLVPVLEYLQEHANQPVFVSELVENLGLTSKNAVQTAVASAIKQDTAGATAHLQILIPGNQWRWNSSPALDKSTNVLYEQLAVTKAGKIIVQDEDGELYQLVEL
jgi:hypothetical protein